MKTNMKDDEQINRQNSDRYSPLQSVAEEEVRHVHALTDGEIRHRMERINDDFRHGFKLVQKHPDTVTFFGSARFKSDNLYYKQARELSRRIVEELGVTIVSGGAGGIMEAANRGAHDAQGESIGMTIELPSEQVTNSFVTHSVDFYYFFSRKVALAFAARAYIYFPGGFGTLDEFFEILTLKQTGKIPPIPIILYGSDYWRPLLKFIESSLLDKFHTVGPKDTAIYTLTDDFDEIIKIVADSKPNPTDIKRRSSP